MAQGRYSEAELALIKSVFKNRELLRAIQRVFLQVPLTAVEQALLQTNINSDICRLLRKMFLPSLNDDVPFDQLADLGGTLDWKNKMSEDMVLHIKAHELTAKYLEQSIKTLENKSWGKKQYLSFKKLSDEKASDKDKFVNYLTRSNIMGTAVGRLVALNQLAEIKEETPEEKEQRNQQNSSK